MEISSREISDKIILIDGKLVIQDKELAEIFNRPTRNINQNYTRNKNCFKEGQSFQLSLEESRLTNPHINWTHPSRVYTKEGVTSLLQRIKLMEVNQQEINFENILKKNLSIIEKQLILVKSQYKLKNSRIDIVAKDRVGTIVIIELQIGRLDREHLYKSIEYRDLYFIKNKSMPRVILVTSDISDEYKQICKIYNLEYKVIPQLEEITLKKSIAVDTFKLQQIFNEAFLMKSKTAF